jgi:aarF domain-containing kinase
METMWSLNCLQTDLGFIYMAARVLEFLQPEWERMSLATVAGDIRQSMLEELDFNLEARNTIEFRRFLQDYSLLSKAAAPRVYLDYTTTRIMTMERLNGVSMLNAETIQQVTKDNPEQGVETIITALNIWSLSLTSMPWFHADVHAGNLLLLHDGRVGFIDFGIVGRISETVFKSVTQLSTALAAQDYQAMAVALCDMGAADKEVDTVAFGKDIERVLNRMNNVDVTALLANDGTAASVNVAVDETEITDLLLELVEVTENNGLKLPREFGLLVKQSLYFDRYLKILAPNVDVMNDSRVQMGGQPSKKKNDDEDSNTKRSGINGERVVIDV